jgi:hypothetical protein
LANSFVEEIVALAEDKGAAFWKKAGKMMQGILFGLTNQASKANNFIAPAVSASR